MITDSSSIAINDILKKEKYDASIILTYNAYLPFYEEVVLRTLQAGGCQNNAILMDSKQLQEAMNGHFTRPKLAGFDYTLLPIKVVGAFHPKIIFLIGKNKACLLIGSHNLTISGFQKNKEITSKIYFKSQNESQEIVFAVKVWKFIKDWIDEQKELIPQDLKDSIYRFANVAPWLKNQSDGLDEKLQFYGTQPDGPSLYEQVFKNISGKIKRIHIVGPFFDSQLKFVNRIINDLSPSELIVGVDPDSVVINESSAINKKIRFVNASDLGDKVTSYLHAKTIYIESNKSEHWLINGSANPSFPAWIGDKNATNVESVVLQSGQDAKEMADIIGISKIDKFKEITKDDWKKIKRNNFQQTALITKDSVFLIATAEYNNININGAKFDFSEFIKVEFFTENNKKLDFKYNVEVGDDNICIDLNKENIRLVRTLKIYLSMERCIHTWVHHTAELKRRSESSSQSKFRAAMSNLEADDPDLATFINIAGNLIFSEQPEIETKSIRKDETKTKGVVNENEVIDLVANEHEIKTQEKKRRVVNSGNIGLLLDAMIYNLGFGVRTKNQGDYTKGRDEEDMVGSDDANKSVVISVLDNDSLIKLCNSKIRSLVNRMIKQFAYSNERKNKYYIPMFQLIAVLALFRQLRKIEKRDGFLTLKESFVPEKERKKLLSESVKYLFGKNYKFASKALIELDHESIDEFSRLNGLLLWLTKDCDIDIRSTGKTDLGVDYSQIRNDSISKVILLILAQIVSTDELAISEAEKSIKETSNDTRGSIDWIEAHKYWGARLLKYTNTLKVKDGIKSKHPDVGDLAFIKLEGNKYFSIVYDSSRYSDIVKIIDIEGDGNLKEHAKSNVLFFEQPFSKENRQ